MEPPQPAREPDPLAMGRSDRSAVKMRRLPYPSGSVDVAAHQLAGSHCAYETYPATPRPDRFHGRRMAGYPALLFNLQPGTAPAARPGPGPGAFTHLIRAGGPGHAAQQGP